MWNLQLVCGIPWWEQPDCLKFWLANLKLNINIFDPGYKFVENLKIVFNYFIKLPRVFIIIQNKTLRIASLNFWLSGVQGTVELSDTWCETVTISANPKLIWIYWSRWSKILAAAYVPEFWPKVAEKGQKRCRKEAEKRRLFLVRFRGSLVRKHFTVAVYQRPRKIQIMTKMRSKISWHRPFNLMAKSSSSIRSSMGHSLCISNLTLNNYLWIYCTVRAFISIWI